MVYEVYGSPDTGKSTTVLKSIKDEEKLCLYVNADFQLLDNLIDSSLYILNTNRIETIKVAKEQKENLIMNGFIIWKLLFL